jgi:hypothetical protein
VPRERHKRLQRLRVVPSPPQQLHDQGDDLLAQRELRRGVPAQQLPERVEQHGREPRSLERALARADRHERAHHALHDAPVRALPGDERDSVLAACERAERAARLEAHICALGVLEKVCEGLGAPTLADRLAALRERRKPPQRGRRAGAHLHVAVCQELLEQHSSALQLVRSERISNHRVVTQCLDKLRDVCALLSR